MTDDVDWSLTTWEGNRRRQHRDFLKLSFREKLEVVEHLGEVAAFFLECHRARKVPAALGSGGPRRVRPAAG